jgi:hopene-associated glycosyltransferase HpnB
MDMADMNFEDLAVVPLAFYLALAVLASWGALMALRGDFWRADQLLVEGGLQPERWPAVAAVVPARNEADVVEQALSSIAAQHYEGDISIFLVDDRSEDDTAELAGRIAGVTVVSGSDAPDGWTGKMWAVAQGVDAMEAAHIAAEYVWLTDADIAHHPGELASLVAGSEHGGLDLNSVMVRLRIERLWDVLLIPAFVFFFQKLYPFPWVNDPARQTAAAAGGSMLVRRSALARIGGIASIAGELIDDCALAQRIKSTGGRIRLSLATETHSIRPYRSIGEIWRMVARTAFHQLNHSAAALAGTIAAMAFLYLLPPVLTVVGLMMGEIPTVFAAVAAWFAMGWAFAPTLYRYGLSPYYGFTLPLAGFLYSLMTVDSARRHWQGRGGEWKGRTHRP